MSTISQTAIKLHMKKKGLTSKQLSILAGVSESYIKSIIYGNRDRISERLIKKIAKLLGIKEKDIRSHLSQVQTNRLFGKDNITF